MPYKIKYCQVLIPHGRNFIQSQGHPSRSGLPESKELLVDPMHSPLGSFTIMVTCSSGVVIMKIRDSSNEGGVTGHVEKRKVILLCLFAAFFEVGQIRVLAE